MSDFDKGVEDCKEGIPHQAFKSTAYDRGYGYQYQLEQRASHG